MFDTTPETTPDTFSTEGDVLRILPEDIISELEFLSRQVARILQHSEPTGQNSKQDVNTIFNTIEWLIKKFVKRIEVVYPERELSTKESKMSLQRILETHSLSQAMREANFLPTIYHYSSFPDERTELRSVANYNKYLQNRHGKPLNQRYLEENFPSSDSVETMQQFAYWIIQLLEYKTDFDIPDILLVPNIIDTVNSVDDKPKNFDKIIGEYCSKNRTNKCIPIQWEKFICVVRPFLKYQSASTRIREVLSNTDLTESYKVDMINNIISHYSDAQISDLEWFMILKLLWNYLPPTMEISTTSYPLLRKVRDCKYSEVINTKTSFSGVLFQVWPKFCKDFRKYAKHSDKLEAKTKKGDNRGHGKFTKLKFYEHKVRQIFTSPTLNKPKDHKDNDDILSDKVQNTKKVTTTIDAQPEELDDDVIHADFTSVHVESPIESPIHSPVESPIESPIESPRSYSLFDDLKFNETTDIPEILTKDNIDSRRRYSVYDDLKLKETVWPKRYSWNPILLEDYYVSDDLWFQSPVDIVLHLNTRVNL